VSTSGPASFAALFGGVRQSCDLVGIAVHAARSGYAVVPVKPGTKQPMCTLTDRARTSADRHAAHEARERGARHWEQITHPCGRVHAITDPVVAARVFKRLVGTYPELNIGIEIGASRCVVVDADTAAEASSFTRLWAAREGMAELVDAAPTVRSPGVMRTEADGSTVWVHKDGGHFWFTLPEHVDLSGAGTSTALKIGADESAKASLMFRDQLVLVPPSTRAEGAYVMASDIQPCPAWMVDELLLHVAGHALRAERHRGACAGGGPIEAWAAATAWDTILGTRGWTTSGRIDGCGCEIWTRPGDWSSPKSATAHEPGCLRFEDTAGFLHLWTDNPPEQLSTAKDWSKLQVLAAYDHGSTGADAIRETCRDLGIDRPDQRVTVVAATDSEVLSGVLSGATGQPDNGPDNRTTGGDGATGDEPGEDVDPVDALLAELIPACELDSIPEPVALVDGVLDLTTLARVVGTSGHGKTFVALDLAAHVATGRAWQGRPCRQGLVVYLVAEGVAGMRNRVRAWEAHHGTALGHQVLFLPRAVQVMRQVDWMVLVAALARLRPVLVVLDTQARMTVGAQENDASDMGVMVDRSELLKAQTGACVLWIHHKGRTGDHGRGSTVVAAAVDVEFSVTRQGRGRITVLSEKQKDREDFEPVSLDLVAVDRSAVLLAAGTRTPAFGKHGVDENSPARDRLAALLFRVFSAGVGATKAEMWAVVREQDRGPRGRPMGRTVFYEAWDKLEAGGHIVWHDTEVGKRCVLDVAEASRIGLLHAVQERSSEDPG
jgi:AAA domain/Bifunctional DNA primase/polymerase, N-terminal